MKNFHVCTTLSGSSYFDTVCLLYIWQINNHVCLLLSMNNNLYSNVFALLKVF